MKIPFFRRASLMLEAPKMTTPETHKRVDVWADKFNASILRYEEYRAACAEEIKDKQEELRQIDAVLAAMRAGLVTLVDDPSLSFPTKTALENNITGDTSAALATEFEDLVK